MNSIIYLDRDTRLRLNPKRKLRKERPPIVRHAIDPRTQRPLCGKGRYAKRPYYQLDLGEPSCGVCLTLMEGHR